MNRRRLFFWNYNTVESTLLASAVLVSAFGVMFDSAFLDEGSAAFNVLQYATLTVIVTSMVYYGIVCWTEIIGAVFPTLGCRFLNGSKDDEDEDEEGVDQDLTEFELSKMEEFNPNIVMNAEEPEEKEDIGILTKEKQKELQFIAAKLETEKKQLENAIEELKNPAVTPSKKSRKPRRAGGEKKNESGLPADPDYGTNQNPMLEAADNSKMETISLDKDDGDDGFGMFGGEEVQDFSLNIDDDGSFGGMNPMMNMKR